jgi:hypothetical protein
MNDFLYFKIISARKVLVATYLKQLKDRINQEDYFDRAIAEKWFEEGKLQNEWRKKAAMQFADTQIEDRKKLLKIRHD